MWLLMLIADYGGEYREHLEAGVTHVVAAQQGTSKVKEAAAVGVRVVHLDWLVDSIRRFRRMDEAQYEALPPERRSDPRLDKLLEELAMSYCPQRVSAMAIKPVHVQEEGEALHEEDMMKMLEQEMQHVSASEESHT